MYLINFKHFAICFQSNTDILKSFTFKKYETNFDKQIFFPTHRPKQIFKVEY